jgi:hypothetical protein
MTAPGLVCGPCGTELPPNAESYNESAVPSYRVVAARGDNCQAWSGHAGQPPVPLAHPGRTSATG